MKKLLQLISVACFLTAPLFAQNWATVSGANITDLNQQKLASGQVCFLATDQGDNPVSFSVGGGGQVLRRPFCSTVTSGAIAAFTVPNPATTLPTGIYYRVTVRDTSSGLEVLRYTQVTFSGTAFNFDLYAPSNLGSFAPLTGNNVSGNLNVTGNITATGTLIGTNMPANTVQTIDSLGSPLTQRPTLNFLGGLSCVDNAISVRTDCRIGTVNTISFSATPVFDATFTSTFKMTLTGNVTSSTLSNAVAGQIIGFEICQDATGGRTFVAPGNVVNFVPIPSASNACILESFLYDGASAFPSQGVAGRLIGPEAAAPAGAAGFDVLYPDSTTHRWKMSNNNAAADTVVGAATTDALSNKTLNGAGNGNSVTLLNSQGTTGPLTGNATDQTVFTFTIPANTVGPGKGIRVSWSQTHTSGTASVTYKLILGSTTITSWSTADIANQHNGTHELINASGVQNSQITRSTVLTNILQALNAATSAENTANALTVKLTFNVANTDQVTGRFWLIELIQ